MTSTDPAYQATITRAMPDPGPNRQRRRRAQREARSARRASPARPCRHPRCTPAFDADAAQGLDEYEVRRRWPRLMGECPDCGQHLISYASAEHYIAGDW